MKVENTTHSTKPMLVDEKSLIGHSNVAKDKI